MQFTLVVPFFSPPIAKLRERVFFQGWQRKLDPDYDVMKTLQALLFKSDWVESLSYTIEGLVAPWRGLPSCQYVLKGACYKSCNEIGVHVSDSYLFWFGNLSALPFCILVCLSTLIKRWITRTHWQESGFCCPHEQKWTKLAFQPEITASKSLNANEVIFNLQIWGLQRHAHAYLLDCCATLRLTKLGPFKILEPELELTYLEPETTAQYLSLWKEVVLTFMLQLMHIPFL